MSIPVIDVQGDSWMYDSDSCDTRRRYFHTDQAANLETIVREQTDGQYAVLVTQNGEVSIDEQFNLPDEETANNLAKDWMDKHSDPYGL